VLKFNASEVYTTYLANIFTKEFSFLSEILLKHDASTANLLAVHLYVQNMKNFGLINSVYKRYFDINPPIR
jgi:diphthine-ammonia ligase